MFLPRGEAPVTKNLPVRQCFMRRRGTRSNRRMILVLLGAWVLRRSSRASDSAGLRFMSPVRSPKRLGREGKLHKSGASVKQSESSESLSSWVLGCGTAATCLSLDLFCFEGGVQGGDTKSMGERGAGTSKGNVLALKSSLTSLHWLLSRIG